MSGPLLAERDILFKLMPIRFRVAVDVRSYGEKWTEGHGGRGSGCGLRHGSASTMIGGQAHHLRSHNGLRHTLALIKEERHHKRGSTKVHCLQ